MAESYGLYLQDHHSLRDSIRYVQYAELRGFDSVWQAETRMARDATIAMAAYAATTMRIKIGSGVMNHWTRNAATLAASFLTLDDLAPDRIRETKPDYLFILPWNLRDEIVRQMSETVGDDHALQLAEWAIPIQKRHKDVVRASSLELAAEEADAV